MGHTNNASLHFSASCTRCGLPLVKAFSKQWAEKNLICGKTRTLVTSVPRASSPMMAPYCVVKGRDGSRRARTSVFAIRG